MSYRITPISAFTDNYIWCLENTANQAALLVDPGQAAPAARFLEEQDLTLEGILLTHHHPDHSGGIDKLVAERDIPVYGPTDSPCGKVTNPLREGESVSWRDLNLEVLEIPGHTLDHIAFFSNSAPLDNPILFCGDTLFACGCGRLFEGQPAQMRHSLAKLRNLPGDTEVYCGHEYTLANLRFSRSVVPNDTNLAEYEAWCREQRDADRPTLPSSIAREARLNPFMRWDDPAVIEAAQRHSQDSGDRIAKSDPDAVFAEVRRWKDHF
ncbi:hydroxyacylglutathione hydrolase [Marinobacteraceae bacterium S3BR75-40.1]